MRRRVPSTQARSGLVLLRAALALRSGRVETLEEALTVALKEVGLSAAAFRRLVDGSRGPLRELFHPPRRRQRPAHRRHPAD